MEEGFLFIVLALATYRVSWMVATEEGPFSAFLWLRNRFIKNNWVSRGIRCPFCLSFWAGLLAAFLMPWRGPGVYFCEAMAFSGVTIILVTVCNRPK